MHGNRTILCAGGRGGRIRPDTSGRCRLPASAGGEGRERHSAPLVDTVPQAALSRSRDAIFPVTSASMVGSSTAVPAGAVRVVAVPQLPVARVNGPAGLIACAAPRLIVEDCLIAGHFAESLLSLKSHADLEMTNNLVTFIAKHAIVAPGDQTLRLSDNTIDGGAALLGLPLDERPPVRLR